jgi:hypothetical protein
MHRARKMLIVVPLSYYYDGRYLFLRKGNDCLRQKGAPLAAIPAISTELGSEVLGAEIGDLAGLGVRVVITVALLLPLRKILLAETFTDSSVKTFVIYLPGRDGFASNVVVALIKVDLLCCKMQR